MSTNAIANRTGQYDVGMYRRGFDGQIEEYEKKTKEA